MKCYSEEKRKRIEDRMIRCIKKVKEDRRMRLDSRDSPVQANNIVQVSREFLLKFVLAEIKKGAKNDKKKGSRKAKSKKKNEFAATLSRRELKKRKPNTQRYQKCIMQ